MSVVSRTLLLTWATAALCSPLYANPQTSAPPPDQETAAGHWDGEITLPAGSLKIAVDLAKEEAGWSGTIDIPAQGLRDFTLSDVSVDGRDVGFKMPKIPGDPTFEGKLSNDGDTLAGEFRQGGATLTFKLVRGEKAAEAQPEFVPGEGLAGDWQGRIDAGVIKLRIVLKLIESDGELTGKLISIDQGNAEIPLEDIELKGRKVSFAAPKAASSFEGTMNEDGSQIEGKWSQAGQKLDLTAGRLAGEAKPVERPQNPKEPLSYDVEEIKFSGGSDGVTLAGTLTMPRGEGPFPAVALLSGSGPQDRDESLMGHRPFLVLADHLTRNGIIVLRFDDRGVGESTGKFGEATTRDFAADAKAAAEYLSAHAKVDADRVGLVGHSEGGLTGPQAAVESDTVKFLVLMAAPGVPMSELLARQSADVLKSMGLGDEFAQSQSATQKKALAMLADIDGPNDPDVATLRKLLEESNASLPDGYREEDPTAAIDAAVKMMTNRWFRELVLTDPAETLRKVRVPVLAINGGTDVQVAADANLPAIEAALRDGGNEEVTTKLFPGLNHLFQHSESGSVAEYGEIEETFAPEALEVISTWILQQ